MRGWIETVVVVPPAYDRYAPLVTDGLLHFLGRLPPARLEAIVADQMLLPMLGAFDRGDFEGRNFLTRTKDWKSWDGAPFGYGKADQGFKNGWFVARGG